MQNPRSMHVLLRADGEPAQLVSALRTAVRELDPDLALAQAGPLDALLEDQIAPRRFNTWLLSAFGARGRSRSRPSASTACSPTSSRCDAIEIAVRLSIGAAPRDVLGLIVRDVSGVLGIGVSLGLAGALAAATAMQGLLFGIRPWDPMSQAITLARARQRRHRVGVDPFAAGHAVDPATVLRAE